MAKECVLEELQDGMTYMWRKVRFKNFKQLKKIKGFKGAISDMFGNGRTKKIPKLTGRWEWWPKPYIWLLEQQECRRVELNNGEDVPVTTKLVWKLSCPIGFKESHKFPRDKSCGNFFNLVPCNEPWRYHACWSPG